MDKATKAVLSIGSAALIAIGFLFFKRDKKVNSGLTTNKPNIQIPEGNIDLQRNTRPLQRKKTVRKSFPRKKVQRKKKASIHKDNDKKVVRKKKVSTSRPARKKVITRKAVSSQRNSEFVSLEKFVEEYSKEINDPGFAEFYKANADIRDQASSEIIERSLAESKDGRISQEDLESMRAINDEFDESLAEYLGKEKFEQFYKKRLEIADRFMKEHMSTRSPSGD